MNTKHMNYTILFLLGCVLSHCSSATGTVQVFITAEDTIPNGLTAGAGEENIQDGWTVTYDKLIIAVGKFSATQSSNPGAVLSESNVYVVDLKQLPSSGLLLATFNEAEAVRWDRVGYQLPHANSAAVKGEGTMQADYDMMIKHAYSHYIEGSITKDASKVSFKWGLSAGTSFEDCAPPQGDAGFTVPSGGTVQVKPTIHGDHWFFTNITQGAEVTERRAQWIADADLDKNGETTIEELKQTKAANLFDATTYNLSGAIIPINSGYDYLEAQARTLGDFQGEGECPTRTPL